MTALKPACPVAGCTETRYGQKDWCQKHYTRWKRHGDPTVSLTFKGVPVEERVRSQIIHLPNGCWLWTGLRRKEGYGYFRHGKRLYQSHRWTYEHFRGPIPAGLHIDHLCREEICVNPWHLEPVTPAENARRNMSPAIIAWRTNRCQKMRHELTPENTIWHNGLRRCRLCQEGRPRGDRRCAGCPAVIEASRRLDARYCSEPCRARASARRQRERIRVCVGAS